MDWSWLPPATFGVVVTLVVTWVQDYLQDRRQRSGEKRARAERRLEEVRESLVSVGKLAYEVARVRRWGDWIANGAVGADARQEWLEELDKKREDMYGSPVAVAFGLFVQDEPLLGKLNAVLEVIDELFKAVLAHTEGGPEGGVIKVQVALGKRMAEAQERMDRIVDEL